jgi:hypothetical protein
MRALGSVASTAEVVASSFSRVRQTRPFFLATPRIPLTSAAVPGRAVHPTGCPALSRGSPRLLATLPAAGAAAS